MSTKMPGLQTADPVSRTEQRACPVCGTAFTWTSASPRQKYCSTRCAQLC